MNEFYTKQSFKTGQVLKADQLNHMENAIKYGGSFFEWEPGGITSDGTHALEGNETGKYSIRTPKSSPYIGDDKFYTFYTNESLSIQLYIFSYIDNGSKLALVDSYTWDFRGVMPFQFKKGFKYYLRASGPTSWKNTERKPDPSKIIITPMFEGSNDYLQIDNKKFNIYNPYTKLQNNQYKGQLHAHSMPGSPKEDPVTKKLMEDIFKNYEVWWGKDEYGNNPETKSDIINDFLETHKSNGYDFITVSDYKNHSQMTHPMSEWKTTAKEKNILWLCDSTEFSIDGDNVQGTGVSAPSTHVVQYLISNNKLGDGAFREQRDILLKRGGLLNWAHPMQSGGWNSVNVNRYIENFRYVDVWNGYNTKNSIDGKKQPTLKAQEDDMISQKGWGYPATDFAFDLALQNNKRMFCTAVSDIHLKDMEVINNGYVKVFAESCSQHEIWNSLLTGNFYASTGANIKFCGLKNHNSLEVQLDEGVNGIIEFIVYHTNGEQEIISKPNTNSAEYTFNGSELYARARVIVNSNDKEIYAWTQAIQIEQNKLPSENNLYGYWIFNKSISFDDIDLSESLTVSIYMNFGKSNGPTRSAQGIQIDKENGTIQYKLQDGDEWNYQDIFYPKDKNEDYTDMHPQDQEAYGDWIKYYLDAEKKNYINPRYIGFGTEPQQVSKEFYDWLIKNATFIYDINAI